MRTKSVFGANDRRPKCVRAEPVAGNAIRAESDQSGSEAREPSVGEDGEGPKFVRATSVAENAVWAESDQSKVERPSVGGNGDSPRCVGVSGEGAMTTPSIRRLLSGFLIPDHPERFV
ncbi:hypothetical protein ABIE64_001922 [Thalassospira sp. MBR-102]|uniref:hypothetical protein n=1 Tax=Thalassospira sp. MBR-102 TaxID=3156466 RepID=UPI00339638B9